MRSRRLANRVRFHVIAVVAAGALLFGPPVQTTHAEEDAEKLAAEARRDRYTNWMRTYAEGTNITLPADDRRNAQKAELVPNPVFRYSDEQRAIPDATLWVWTRNARPVAFQKVEGNNHGGGQGWTICFASLSEQLVHVRWPANREFSAASPA